MLKLISTAFIIFVSICTSSSFADSFRYIRVAVLSDASSISLKINGSYEITDTRGSVLAEGTVLKTTVTTYKGGISWGGSFFKTPKVFIKATDSGPISVNGRLFKGSIQLIKNKDAAFTVVNQVELEDYIKGILYHEASHYWPMEALKAQAIASRSYALYQMQENKLNSFDVTSDIYSQVYGGKTSERYRTSMAVDETKGLALTYRGKLFSAYFSATCGGHTEDASKLWNTDIAPLKGVPCGFCKDSPHFNWHYVLTLEEIEEKLAEGRFRVKKIKDLRVIDKDSSGRVANLKIIGADKEVKIPAKDFREWIGPNIIRSTHFTIKLAQKDLIFEGIGWGHGVGLCQWGAYFMAKQGRTASEILCYYYPGSEINQLPVAGNW